MRVAPVYQSHSSGAGESLFMLRVLSTHLFLNQRLHPGLLEHASLSGAQAVEIFAARQHFDYTSREHVGELANWFRSNTLEAFSLHAPLYPDQEMGRAGAPAVNVLHPEKSRRIDAMDEMKRALETADQIPFRNLIVHLGERTDSWSQRSIEYAQTALEHLGAFASPLGVRLLVESPEPSALSLWPASRSSRHQAIDARPSPRGCRVRELSRCGCPA
jgi:sugar phosphate isomerase/epimerase